MYKRPLLLILPLVLFNAFPFWLSAQNQHEPDKLWLSLGGAHFSSYRSLTAPIPDRKLRIVHQNEYHISIGSVGNTVNLSYLTLELNTFYFDTDFITGAIDRKDNMPYARNEIALIHETKRLKMQSNVTFSASFERQFKLMDKVLVSLGARLGYSIGKSDYSINSTWGYGGNGIDQFDRIESNILKPTGLYRGVKASVLTIVEYKMKDWRIGATFGLQYKTTTYMLGGETVLHRNDGSQRIRNIYFGQDEIGFLSGLRISRYFN